MPALLDPKNDLVFKLIFIRDRMLMADLLNSILRPACPIRSLDVLNPNINPDELTGKFIMLDILGRDPQGTLYNLEMQVRRHIGWHQRCLYYMARTLGTQLKHGQAYHQLKPLVSIHLLGFGLFSNKTQPSWHFELRDTRHPELTFHPGLQLHLVELAQPTPQEHASAPANPALAAWLDFFNHWQEPRIMNHVPHLPVQRAMNRLRQLSANAETRRMAEVRERALITEHLLMSAAREEGRTAGLAEALHLLVQQRFGPLSDDLAQRLHQGTPADLERWMQRLLSAETASALLDQPTPLAGLQ